MTNHVQQAFDLFERISATSSRNEKEAILAEGKGNKPFMDMLTLCYDPYTNFFIKKEPKVESIGTATTDIKWGMFYNLLMDLSGRVVTGNAAIAKVTQFFAICTPQEHKWYWAVLRKDLKIGITEKTINKVFPDTVPVYDCMLAEPIKEKNIPKRAVATRKLDGYRNNIWVFKNGDVELRTRNGNLIEGYTGIEEDAKKLPADWVYDSEILARSGSFRDTQKQVFKKGVKDKDGVAHIFDAVPMEEFKSGKGKTILEKRYQHLNSIDSTIQSAPSLERVEVVYLPVGDKQETIRAIGDTHSQFTGEGYEGTMIGDLDAVYEFKRTHSLMKVKDIQDDDKAFTIDLPIVGTFEGKPGTKNMGKLGGLIVEMTHQDILGQVPEALQPNFLYEGKFLVKVGSGFTPKQREELWATRNEIVGKVIQIKAQEVTTNQNGGHSLRFGIFEYFRLDK